MNPRGRNHSYSIMCRKTYRNWLQEQIIIKLFVCYRNSRQNVAIKSLIFEWRYENQKKCFNSVWVSLVWWFSWVSSREFELSRYVSMKIVAAKFNDFYKFKLREETACERNSFSLFPALSAVLTETWTQKLKQNARVSRKFTLKRSASQKASIETLHLQSQSWTLFGKP